MIFTLVVYNLLLLLLTPAAIVVILWQLVFDDKSKGGFAERLGFIPGRKTDGAGPCVWLHAVSVGETMAAKPIWEALLRVMPGWRLLHSTTTDTGQALAVKGVAGQGQVLYMPFDFLPCIWLALRRVRPQLLVLVETELWPNLLAVAKLMGCKIMIVNGRISDRSLRGAAKVGPVYRWMTSNIDCFCMQSEEDANRIIRLGADPARVVVVGNAKFDQAMTHVSLGEQFTLRNALGLTRDEPVLLAGSTHPGEEEIVLRAFRQVKTAYPQVRLIIAPRSLHRAHEIEELVVAHGFSVARRTKMETVPSPPDAVILLDTIGELTSAYSLCVAAFVGGSLVPVGGHNILEPLALGKPAIFGPQMSNFRDIAALALEAEVGWQIENADELAAEWQLFLVNPARAEAVIDRAERVFQQHRGASQRCSAEAAHLAGVSAPPALV